MRIFLISMTLYLGFSSVCFADHECRVLASAQVFQKSPFKFVNFFQTYTEWFPVTPEAHEIPYSLNLSHDGISDGTVIVWTGTLNNSTEGDVIQANADVSLFENSKTLTLIMATQSEFAKTLYSFEQEQENKTILATIELKCKKI